MEDVGLEPAGAQLICTARVGGEALGFVAIDSTVGGRSCGGLRFAPDVDEAEVRGLARAMTLKYGFLGLPQGGAKAGLRRDPEAPPAERRERLAAFARAMAPLLRRRLYIPGPDMGTNTADIRYVLETAGLRIEARELRGSRSAHYAALTAMAGVRTAARHLGLSLTGCSAAIEGYGKVGSALATLLAEAGARVVAVSTVRGALYNARGLDVPRLNGLAAAAGPALVDAYPDAERLGCAALLELPVDVLAPCARAGSVHSGNATRVVARIISPGANIPITPEAERILFERGALCLPDFATSSGGVLGDTMEFAGMTQARIAALIERRVARRLAWLLEEAARRGVAVRAVAEPLALERHEQLQQAAAHPQPLGRLFAAGLELYRRGWLPRSLVGALAGPYFERTIA